MLFNADRTVTLQTRTCIHCQGTCKVAGEKKCPKCKGTTRGPRGGLGRCGCFRGMVPDFDNKVPCTNCTDGQEPETITDSVPKEQYRALFASNTIPIEFTEANRGSSFNESLIGLGLVAGIQDYGTIWDRLHRGEELDVHNEIREDIANGWNQLCKIARKDGDKIRLCAKLVVILHRGGYSARASFTDDTTAVVKAANSELPESAGMAYGTRMAEQGLNGTLLAASAHTQ